MPWLRRVVRVPATRNSQKRKNARMANSFLRSELCSIKVGCIHPEGESKDSLPEIRMIAISSY